MTKQIGYQPTDAQRIAGQARTINKLLRRQQKPADGSVEYANLSLVSGADTPFVVTPSSVTSLVFPHFTTSNSAVFSFASTPQVSLLKRGLYLCSVATSWAGGAATFYSYTRWDPGGLDLHVATGANSATTTTRGGFALWNQDQTQIIVNGPPLDLDIFVYQDDAGNHSIDNAYAGLIYLGDFSG